MSRSPEVVLAELLALSPSGEGLLLQQAGTNWAAFLVPLAAEISRFEGYADDMLAEVDPGTAQYLLPDYQRVLGPDPYGRDATALTLADQQALAHSRWTQSWGVRPADFIAFTASFGVTVTITEYSLTTIGAYIGDFLVNNATQFTWVVNMPPAAIEWPYVNAACVGDFLGSFAPSLVQPAIAGRAPAHTNPVFNYA